MEPADQRNMLLALVLCFGLFALYNIFVLEPQQRAQREARARAQTETVTTAPSPTQTLLPREEVIAKEIAAGTRVVIDAPSIQGSVSVNGARIDDVSLKGFYETIEDKKAKRESGRVHLLSPPGTERAFYAAVAWKTPQFSTADAVWTLTSAGPLTPENPLRLTYSGPSANIDRTVAVDADYMFTITDTLTNTGAQPITLTPAVEIRQRSLPELLKPAPNAHAGVVGTYGERKNQTVWYADLDKGKGVAEEVNAGWIALTTKYWMAAAVPPQGESVQMKAGVTKGNGETIFNAGYETTPYTIQPGQSLTKTAKVFAGAKRVAVLDRYEHEQMIPAFTDAVDWSWLFFITKPFFWMLQMFQGWFGSFGLAILALTVVVKTVFFPLQFNMYKSMSKMRKLQPEMKSLQERFAADPQRMRTEQAELFKREKVNPLAGCLPLIPQMFVFWALYHTLIVTIEMRHAPFPGVSWFPNTWIQDMSAPDPTTIFNLFGLLPFNPGAIPFIGGFLMVGVWPILYSASMFANQSMATPPTDAMQRAIMRWIPLIFLFVFAGLSSGLVIYWTWSGLISVVQQYIIMRRTGVETEFDKLFKKYFGKKAEAA
jgi:YidC/Oxa1 family membrane protein insertase